jgi:DinB family protein
MARAMSPQPPTTKPEVWLRGPVADVLPELQPVAHSLLQVREEIEASSSLSPEQLWARLGGAASIGFHLAHLAGSLDRLLTYARDETLNATQRAALAAEAREDRPGQTPDGLALVPVQLVLVQAALDALDRALAQVRATPLCTLDQARAVGRARLPSTVLGLLVHAAEHAQRHSAQIITTAKILKGSSSVRLT